MGLSSSMLLDRVAGGMDASSTHEEIYDEYCRVCPQPQPAFSTTSTHLRKLGYTTKRLSSWNPARNDARCAAWYARVKALFPRCCVSTRSGATRRRPTGTAAARSVVARP